MASSPGVTIDIKQNTGIGSITYYGGSGQDVSLRREELPQGSGFWKFKHTKNGIQSESTFKVEKVEYGPNGPTVDVGVKDNIKHLAVWYWKEKTVDMTNPLLIEILKGDNTYDYHFNKGSGSDSTMSWSPFDGNSRTIQLTGNDLEAKLDHLNCNLNQAVTITLTFELSSKRSETHARNSDKNKYCCNYHSPNGLNRNGNISVNKGEIRVNSAKKADYFKHTINSGDYKLAKIKYHITNGDRKWRRIKSDNLGLPIQGYVSIYVFYCSNNPELIYVKGNGNNGTNRWYHKPDSSSHNNGDEQWTPVLPGLQNIAPEDISNNCDNWNKLAKELSCARTATCKEPLGTKVTFEPKSSSQGPGAGGATGEGPSIGGLLGDIIKDALSGAISVVNDPNFSKNLADIGNAGSAIAGAGIQLAGETLPLALEIADKTIQSILPASEPPAPQASTAEPTPTPARSVAGAGILAGYGLYGLISGVFGGSSAVGLAEPQKTTCTIKLVGFDASKKIAVIKVVRSICGLGLRESKELVESFPRAIKKDVPREEAEKFAKEIQEAGGTVDLE